MKIRSHRIAAGAREGQCRDCGKYDAYSATSNCALCAMERMADAEHTILHNPQERFIRLADERWRQVSKDLDSGWIKPNRFYVYVGHNDGGSLGAPMGEENPSTWVCPTADQAQDDAVVLLSRYPEVWVVTTVGCWNAQARP